MPSSPARNDRTPCPSLSPWQTREPRGTPLQLLPLLAARLARSPPITFRGDRLWPVPCFRGSGAIDLPNRGNSHRRPPSPRKSLLRSRIAHSCHSDRWLTAPQRSSRFPSERFGRFDASTPQFAAKSPTWSAVPSSGPRSLSPDPGLWLAGAGRSKSDRVENGSLPQKGAERHVASPGGSRRRRMHGALICAVFLPLRFVFSVAGVRRAKPWNRPPPSSRRLRSVCSGDLLRTPAPPRRFSNPALPSVQPGNPATPWLSPPREPF